jgi:hypothetical protein
VEPPFVTTDHRQVIGYCVRFDRLGLAMATKEPQYTVIRMDAVFEVRRYEPYLVAETVVSATP